MDEAIFARFYKDYKFYKDFYRNNYQRLIDLEYKYGEYKKWMEDPFKGYEWAYDKFVLVNGLKEEVAQSILNSLKGRAQDTSIIQNYGNNYGNNGWLDWLTQNKDQKNLWITFQNSVKTEIDKIWTKDFPGDPNPYDWGSTIWSFKTVGGDKNANQFYVDITPDIIDPNQKDPLKTLQYKIHLDWMIVNVPERITDDSHTDQHKFYTYNDVKDGNSLHPITDLDRPYLLFSQAQCTIMDSYERFDNNPKIALFFYDLINLNFNAIFFDAIITAKGDNHPFDFIPQRIPTWYKGSSAINKDFIPKEKPGTSPTTNPAFPYLPPLHYQIYQILKDTFPKPILL